MRDIWAFLMQTLTASGVAVMVLAVKWLFRDKLSPRWQFSVWGILGCALLLPAGWSGRYVLVNWPALVSAGRMVMTGGYERTMVDVPVPLPLPGFPETVTDWAFVIYEAGVVCFLARYMISYLSLKKALRRQERYQEEGKKR